MQKACITILVFLCLALAANAQMQRAGSEVNVRFSEQISNGPAGTCGCFALEGAAGDLYWNFSKFAARNGQGVGLAADVGVEHTGSVNGAPYGLTLTTFAAGPRFVFSPVRQLVPFAQVLFGLAHGSGSQFPEGNSLVPSANSFALDVGAGADYPLNSRISVRLLQVDYLRTSLPNNTTNWQNNLRLGAGFSLQLTR